MKRGKLFGLILTLALTLALFGGIFTFNSSAAAVSGICGDRIDWTFNTDTGVLNIYGYGEMYENSYSQWEHLSGEIKTVYISHGITNIPRLAFFLCRELTSVTVPYGVSSIDYGAFYGCSALIYVNFPVSLMNIAAYAFYGCISLKTVNLPYGVESIGIFAFKDCVELTNVTIPDSVTDIDVSVFSNMGIINDPAGWENGALYIGSHLIRVKTDFMGAFIIKDGTKTIAGDAFANCEGITRITVPNSVAHISRGAFYKCTGLTDITIPQGITNIKTETFQGCSALTGIVVPDSVTSIAEAAFADCKSLRNMTLPFVGSGSPEKNSYNTYFGYIFGVRHYYYSPYDSFNNFSTFDYFYNYSIPPKLTTVIITGGTSIAAHAFADFGKIESITLPESITSIGVMAFKDCVSLKNINIPDGVTSIGGHAFLRTALYKDESKRDNGVFYIGKHLIDAYSGVSETYGELSGEYTVKPGTLTIADSAFSSCNRLTAVTLPDSLVSIGDYAFFCCTGLAAVTVPDSVKSIGFSAFKGCQSLSNLTLPFPGGGEGRNYFGYIFGATDFTENIFSVPASLKTVTVTKSNIGTYAFTNCVYIENVIFFEGITTIGGSAFSDCDRLTSVTIPRSVSEIYNAFSDCLKLEKIFYGGSQCEWASLTKNTVATSALLSADVEYAVKDESGNPDGTPSIPDPGSETPVIDLPGETTAAAETSGTNSVNSDNSGCAGFAGAGGISAVMIFGTAAFTVALKRKKQLT